MLRPRTRDALTGGPWRRRRRMRRLLEELDRIDAGGATVGSAARRPGDGARTATTVLVAAVLAVTIGSLFAHKIWGLTLDSDGLHVANPLGMPPEVPSGAGSFAYMQTQLGSSDPVAYDPCQPVTYVVNDALAPQGANGILVSAVREVSAATGLVFTFEGATDRMPDRGGIAAGRRGTPVLVAWTTPEEVPDLRGSVAGTGGSRARGDGLTGELVYETGQVALDAPQLGEVLSLPGGRAHVRAVVLHELGHLVGLAHVADPNELMCSEIVGRTALGPGDREGLARLGSGPCFH